MSETKKQSRDCHGTSCLAMTYSFIITLQ